MNNNSTNINKMNNHLSPQLIEDKKKNTKYDIGIPYSSKTGLNR